MTDLDRLIKLESERHDECNEAEWLKWHEEYQSLYEKLKKAEELQNNNIETMKTLEKEDLFYYLMDEKYWDLQRFGSFFKLETRQEYDKKTCLAIRDMIINLIKSGGSNQKSQEDIEKIKNWDNLNSGFREKVDWSRIQFVAVSEHNKENPIISEFNSHTERLEKEIQQLKEERNNAVILKNYDLQDLFNKCEKLKDSKTNAQIVEKIKDIIKLHDTADISDFKFCLKVKSILKETK